MIHDAPSPIFLLFILLMDLQSPETIQKKIDQAIVKQELARGKRQEEPKMRPETTRGQKKGLKIKQPKLTSVQNNCYVIAKSYWTTLLGTTDTLTGVQ